LYKKGKHGMGAHFVNALDNQAAQADAVRKKLHGWRDFNLEKSHALAIGERGHAELTASGGDGEFTFTIEWKILRLGEKLHAGEQLRQECLPVFPEITLLKLGLAVG
jgi:hypothetical protein